MKIVLDANKSVQENAQSLFEESKKLKQKAKGALVGIKQVEQKLAELEKKIVKEKPRAPTKLRSKEWFEKFRWCYTRNGLLIVGGRDAHSNEAVVKRHMEESDWYFHADVHGAPHCVLKCGKEKPSKEDFEDAAGFAGLFSSVWKKGSLSVRVYAVRPEQVSKKAPSGESIGRGAFMIYGERKWFDPVLHMGVGVQEVQDGFRVLCGPLVCVKKHALHVVELVPGEKSKTDVAKAYLKWLSKKEASIVLSVDELVSVLPPGEFSLKLYS